MHPFAACRHLPAFGLCLLLAAGAAGCSPAEKAEPAPSLSSSPTAVPAQPETAEAAPSQEPTPTPQASASSAPASSPTALPSPALSDAFPGWGAGMPAVATKASIPGTWYSGEHVLSNPDGDIQVLLFPDQAWIYSDNWNTLQPYGASPDTGYINNGVVLAGGAIPEGVTAYEEWPLGAPAEEGAPFRDPEVLAYGMPVYLGSHVCGATAQGVTCWNIDTGHGAFVTRTGFTSF